MGLSCEGQGEERGDTATRCVLESKVSAHRLNETPSNSQTETDAVLLGARPVSEALKGLKDCGPLGRGDAGAAIHDPEFHMVGDGVRLDPDRAVGWRPAEGVVDHIGDGALEQRGVGRDGRQRLGHAIARFVVSRERLLTAENTTSSGAVDRRLMLSTPA